MVTRDASSRRPPCSEQSNTDVAQQTPYSAPYTTMIPELKKKNVSSAKRLTIDSDAIPLTVLVDDVH